MNKKVFISRELPNIAEESLRKEGFQVSSFTEHRPMKQEELIQAVKGYQALISLSENKIDSFFLNQCRHLEVISQFAAGFDNIDVLEANNLKIPIGNTPDAMSQATADVAFGLMIAVSRKMFFLHKTINRGQWNHFMPQAHLGFELKGKTLGIFGLGRIGYEMAVLCKGAYQMDIIYCNRSINKKVETELNARKVNFIDLLNHSDVLSVHCELNNETRGIFDKQAFDMMKNNSIFINTSRGSVHNEMDLIKALEKDVIWGAGLDVTNPEPMKITNPLLQMENVAVLPHIGSATIEARTEMARLAAWNIIEYYRTGEMSNMINPASD